jgi:hypothetical protein
MSDLYRAKGTRIVGSKEDIYQEFDLKELTGVDLSDNLPAKARFAQIVIDKILDRTEANKDINNSDFKDYKESYINSTEFELYGKSKGDVNMTLTGDMLNDLDIIESKGNTIKIGFTKDINQKKAANHNQAIGKGIRKRQFFGVKKTDLIDEIETLKEESRIRKAEELTPQKIQDINAEVEAILAATQNVKITLDTTQEDLFDGFIRKLFG